MDLTQNHFIVCVSMKCVVVLFTHNTFAYLKCSGVLLHELQIANDEINLTFQESISILTDAEKLKILSDLDIEESKRDAILRVGIIRDVQTQNEMLKNVIGLDDHTIEVIRSKGVLQIHPIEYQKFTTVPPANLSHVQRGSIISVVNKNGHLENARIERIEGENIYIKIDQKEEIKIVSRKDAYQPISQGRQVYYPDENGIPSRQYISYIDSNNINQHRLNKLSGYDDSTQELLYINDLGLRPRREMATNGEDYSKRITIKSIIFIWNLYANLKRHYNLYGINEDVIDLNNELLRILSIEMRKAGIVTRLQSSDINFENGDAIYDSLIMNLSIEGVHENGSRLMRRYMKIAERLNVPSIEVFPLIELKKDHIGRSYSKTSGLELYVDSAIDILSENDDDYTIAHELSHDIFSFRSITKSHPTVYNTTFAATGESKLNNDNYYTEVLSLSELYAYTSSLLFLSRRLLRSHSIIKRISNVLNPFVRLQNMQDKVGQIQGKLEVMKIINESVQNFFNRIKKDSCTTISPERVEKDDTDTFMLRLLAVQCLSKKQEEGRITYTDNEDRIIVIFVSRERDEILNSPLSFLFQHEVNQLIEKIREKNDRFCTF